MADSYDVVNRKGEAVIKLIMTINGGAATGEASTPPTGYVPILSCRNRCQNYRSSACMPSSDVVLSVANELRLHLRGE